MRTRLDRITADVEALTDDPRDWGRDQLDDAVAVWARIDDLIATLTVLRRDHGVVLARRLPDEYKTPSGTHVHRTTPKTEAWDGHGVLTHLAEPVITGDGEKVDAIRLDVAAKVIPACTQGATSSKWKITELRKVLPGADTYRDTIWGDPVIAKGPLPAAARRSKPPPVTDATDAVLSTTGCAELDDRV